jgi:hypothetical protein
MKKFFLLALVAIATGTSAFAEPATISTKALKHVAASYKNAKDISWSTNEAFSKISFMLGEEKVETFYTTEGDLIGTTRSMAFDKLPKAAIETITTKYTYPQYQLKECIEFTSAYNENNYYISLTAANDNLVLEISKNGAVRVFSKTRK